MFKHVLKIIFITVAVFTPLVGSSNSYFSDTATISGNIITAGYWITPTLTPTPTETPTPTPTPTPTQPGPGSVVINEVMWMGSTESTADEWIELRNMTDRDVDLSNWRIDHAVSGNGGHLEIPDNHIIPANGYFLIANYDSDNDKGAIKDSIIADYSTPSLNLDNDYQDNGTLILKDKDQNIIDSTPTPTSSSWPQGFNSSSIRKSMERENIPGDGTVTSNWHTCTDVVCNDTTYWDSENGNYGTPKALNHSGEPRLEVSVPSNGTLSFTASNIKDFNKLSYQLNYDTDTISDGVTGTISLSNQDEYTEGPLTLGTCSSGGTCVYYSGVKNIKLKVELQNEGSTTTLEKSL